MRFIANPARALHGHAAAPAHAFDPWFPHGSRGAFFNLGLASWHEQRGAWLARPPGHTRRRPRRLTDPDALCEMLEDGGMGLLLSPGGETVALSELIECCMDVWGVTTGGDSGSDSD